MRNHLTNAGKAILEASRNTETPIEFVGYEALNLSDRQLNSLSNPIIPDVTSPAVYRGTELYYTLAYDNYLNLYASPPLDSPHFRYNAFALLVKDENETVTRFMIATSEVRNPKFGVTTDKIGMRLYKYFMLKAKGITSLFNLEKLQQVTPDFGRAASNPVYATYNQAIIQQEDKLLAINSLNEWFAIQFEKIGTTSVRKACYVARTPLPDGFRYVLSADGSVAKNLHGKSLMERIDAN